MKRYEELIKGLQILGEHLGDVEMQPEHDIFYAGPSLSELPNAVNQKMKAAGWHKSDADNWAINT